MTPPSAGSNSEIKKSGLYGPLFGWVYYKRMIKAVIFDYTGVFTREGEEMVTLVRQVKEAGLSVFILSNLFIGQEHQGVLSELIDSGYFAGQTGFIKPDPKAFQLVLDENNLQPEECVYFDDLKTNVEAASQLGIQSFLFESTAKTKETLRELKVL